MNTPNTNNNRNQQQVSQATGFVTVASKLPHGIKLRLDRMIETREPVLGGGWRETKMAERVQEVEILGAATPYGSMPAHPVIGEFALTQNVPADFWEEWLKRNADSDLVKNRVLFAYAKPEDVKAAVRDHEKVQTGLEPLDQERDARADVRIEKGDRKVA